MKMFFILAWKSLLSRKDTVLLTVLSLSLSLFLILSVEVVRRAAEEGFTQTLSQTDLIVGARTGPTNLVLATVFNRGVFANNMAETSYQRWKKHPAVEWTIPLALGDGHRGYRVVGTTEAFYQHYRYQGNQSLSLREGAWGEQRQDVVIGAEVAKKLAYKLGQKVVIDHGVTRDVGMLHHDEHPFTVVGVLAATGTIIDQSLFVTLESLEAMHAEEGKQHDHEEKEHGAADTHHDAQPQPESSHHSISAFFMKLKNRVDILHVQRAINNDPHEPLSAVIPSVVVNELWHMLSYVENALKVLGLCIFAVSLLSMVSILMATLAERRREMAILRALGARPMQISGLLLCESALITLGSSLIGVGLLFFALWSMHEWLKEQFGLFVSPSMLDGDALLSIVWMIAAGVLAGIIPAWRLYRSSLKDGLSVR